MTPLLHLQGFEVRYGAVEAVRGIDIAIEKGEIVALLGANGAGKSSTLNAIAGLTPIVGGRLLFEGRDITVLPAEARPGLGLTLTPEGRRVFGTLSVEDNLAMGAFVAGGQSAIDQAYERVFDLFPILAERRRQFAGTLSGGQQQMLAIGRALMCSPRLLLLDEPSLGLAPIIVEQVFSLIQTLRGQGVTLFIVEQNVAQALHIADRAYMMASGQIVRAGPADEMLAGDALETIYLDHA